MIPSSIQGHLTHALLESSNGPCRLLHGRGKNFGGDLDFINVDRFQDVILICVYSEQAENNALGLIDFFDNQRNAFGLSCLAIQRRYMSHAPTEVVRGTMPARIFAEEHGLRYNLSIGDRQNVGFFPDMFVIRKWFLDHSHEKKILNLFAYTCSISVAAIQGGAAQVVNIDMSAPALNTGRENHRLNNLDTRKAEFQKLNILKSWGRIGRRGPYDIIFIDPPTRQKGSFDTDRDYKKVVRRTAQMLTPGGTLIACSNSPDHSPGFLKEIVSREAPELTFLHRLPNHARFNNANPEEGLKIFFYSLKTPSSKNPIGRLFAKNEDYH